MRSAPERRLDARFRPGAPASGRRRGTRGSRLSEDTRTCTGTSARRTYRSCIGKSGRRNEHRRLSLPARPRSAGPGGYITDMEQRVKGSGSGWWVCSRPGAADDPWQRRWIRLTFAGRDGMTGNRRELPRSSVAGHRRPVPHSDVEGSPCGWAHPLLEVERLWGSAVAEWLLGGDRPAAAGHPLPASVEALLAAPGAFDVGRVLAALAAGELVADRRPPAGVPGRLDQQPADVRVADLGDRALPALLAAGALRGDEADEGHELGSGLEAIEVADLGDERERGQGVDPTQATQPADERPPRLLLGGLADRLLQLLDSRVDEIDRVHVAVE